MNDKPIAMLVTAAIICPICMLSILAPAFLGSAVAGVFAWFGGFVPVAVLGLAVRSSSVSAARKARKISSVTCSGAIPCTEQ